jgi:DNA-binding response OmpR family regulator
VIDDESKLRELVGDYLRRDGFAVVEAGTGRAALDVIARARPDLVILDLGLPDVDGEDLLRSFRRQNLPVVVLTAKASEPERVAGLRAGADDYLVKPFSPRELIARVEAVLRRSGHAGFGAATAYGGGALLLDTERREVAVRGREVALTRSEFDLLAVLAGRPGRVWSRLELLSRLQGNGFEGFERTVDAHVKNLRRKLGDEPPNPTLVLTVTGVGYKLGVDRDV